jgi:hypothetical protein
MSRWSINKYPLEPPSLSELAAVINTGLKSNFKDVTASVTCCPDLRETPFHLAAAGISGNERIADVGGPAFLHPMPQLDRKYPLRELMTEMGMNASQGFVLGAAAGPFHILGTNSELMPNFSYGAGEVKNLTRFAKIDEAGGCVCEAIPEKAMDCALMANLFGSDGRQGDVIKIMAGRRVGSLNFLAAIQETLRARYGSRPISMGGVFIIRRGKVSMHVMPDFSTVPLETDQVPKWLRFFEMKAPLVCLTTFHSHDPGMDLRMEHTHCFSDHGEGGHYHGDTTPQEVEYEAYLNTAKVLYRIDQPKA